MTDASQTSQPTPVPAGASPVGAVRARWAWTAPEVWTERMLTALEEGVRGGRWYTLMDKVCAVPTLRAAFARVKANRGAAGVDHVTVAMYAARLDAHLATLSATLRDGTYRPQPIRRHWIPKGPRERRPLGIPTVRDRVVQTALRLVLDPIFDRTFAAHSYGFRPGRGAKDALRRVDTLLRAGYRYVVDADLQAYFDTIPHAPLRARVASTVSDGRVLALVDAFLHQPIFEGLAQWTVEEGTPQGAVISPLLANLYLDPLDHAMADAGYEMVRYADDFVVLCRTPEDAQQALAIVRRWTEAAGLRLHPEKTHLVDLPHPGGFDFLGYHFERRYRLPRTKSLTKLKDAVRQTTRRTHGHSLAAIIDDLNRILRGWFEYFKHGRAHAFVPIDAWVRMRLRCLLRHRLGRRGRSIRFDHHQWPRRFFTAQGLLSLTQAHAAVRRSYVR
ncbi:MAG TPA: group II intron reverse transcriptase/maturase [Vicinamibacterales bacterium]|nr:group II intron reverse transcriptase/maturase [Vicinamibacterales bacterium]